MEEVTSPTEPTVSPQSVSLSLRSGLPQNFTIKVSPPSSISVGMYVLMDLSFTMRDDFESLGQFSEELVRQMQNLTDEFRIGFGSFIGKPVSPFIDRNSNFSCAADHPDVTESECEFTYAFRYHLDFTSDTEIFKAELGSAKISSSVDQPEALLDTILQVAACQSEIGWRDVEDARRLILVLTDGEYHIALDGKILHLVFDILYTYNVIRDKISQGMLAGLCEQPDRQCRLDPVTKVYEYASQVVLNSPVCSNLGTYECSTCICPSNCNEPVCQCPVTNVGTGGGCTKSGNSTELCSGRGTCTCNKCECNIADNGHKYQGQNCKCDPTLSPSGMHESGRVLPCTSHSVCGCDGQCACENRYSDTNCEYMYTSDTGSCVAPKDRDTGDSGQCTCGTCLCNDYSIRYDLYCEECSVCVRSCSLLSSCIQCHIEQNCPSSCDHVTIISPSEYNSTDEVLKTCSITCNNCEVTYQVGIYVLGTEGSITVLFDQSQDDINDWSDGCSSSLPIWVIPLVVTVFMCCSGENPLFIDPTTSHINPKYRPRPTVQVVGGGEN